MLTFLKVRNLAIVEEFEIEPGPGLNVLTGETGAGKSLLIDSLDFLAGARGSTELIRSGQERMSVEAVFHLDQSMRKPLTEAGVELENGPEELELIVRRDLSAGGRGRVLINGSPVPVRELTQVMDQILEIHGQSEARDRIAGQTYRELLDQFGRHGGLLKQVAQSYHEWKRHSLELEKLRNAQRDRALRLDLLKYQIGEIATARLEPAEEEGLRNEREVLAHAQEMIEATAGAYKLLEEDEDSALPLASRASHLLQPLASRIPAIGQAHAELEDARHRLSEIARALSHLSDSVRHDPARLDAIEERLALIDSLKKKYGGSIDSILEHHDQSRTEYEQLTDFETHLARLEKIEQSALEEYRKSASEISQLRKQASEDLGRSIRKELDDLAMPGTSVEIVVTSESRSATGHSATTVGGPHGFDRVDILIAPNRGEESRPVHKIASGGELSRIQLAVAAALFKQSQEKAAATLVFDEIDAGIGGRVAEVVGRKLKELASTNQVICVTHLPQIASFGSTHFRVWKDDENGHTHARIERLGKEAERIEEIARMLGGSVVTESARQHASELVQQAVRKEPGKQPSSSPVRKSR